MDSIFLNTDPYTPGPERCNKLGHPRVCSQVPNFQSSRNYKFQSSQVPKFPELQAPKFPELQVPKFLFFLI